MKQKRLKIITTYWVASNTLLITNIKHLFRSTFDRDFARFLYEFLPFENVLTSKNGHRGCYDVFGGNSILKRQKFMQKSRETAIENWLRLCSILYNFLRFEVTIMSSEVTVFSKSKNSCKITRNRQKTAVHGSTRRLDFINQVSHGRQLRISSILAY